jgi:hypothetical protein
MCGTCFEYPVSQFSARTERCGGANTKAHPRKRLIDAIDILRENVQDPGGGYEFHWSPEEQEGEWYLPVGVCSKNDKGACINEFNILAEPQVSPSNGVGEWIHSRRRATVSNSSARTTTTARP